MGGFYPEENLSVFWQLVLLYFFISVVSNLMFWHPEQKATKPPKQAPPKGSYKFFQIDKFSHEGTIGASLGWRYRLGSTGARTLVN